MNYFEFFETQDEAIAHCRKRNRGMSSTNPNCCAVVDGPGCTADPEENHPSDCTCCDYAVVDLETAKELVNEGGGGWSTYLIVTD